MTTASTLPRDQFVLPLTEEERARLAVWLKERLNNKRIEEHRTDALDYKQSVASEVAILESVLARLHP